LKSVFVLLGLALATAQAPTSAQSAQTPEVSKSPEKQAEAVVVESLRTAVRFENDGTGTRESVAVVHVLSEAGVKQLGLLTVGYSSANEDLSFPYVRVRKPDGTVIPTPPGNIVDTTPEITREAPMFSDYREKHVTVRGLAVGDRLEYDALVRVQHPLAPGQFWTNYTFTRNGTLLDEELEVNLPKDREVNVKSTDVKPAVREEGDRRIYTWKTSHQGSGPEMQLTDEIPPPPVEISTFKSWDELGRWWGGLEEERAVVTPELRAKAEDLTKDAKSDREKVQALYKYVALNFRYVSISFGLGRVQPHDADDVFQNGYGDCKDKHTLLATMLKVVGIGSESVLINSSVKLDPDAPSPGQFDHVITRVPLSDGPVWLDTTTEVAPFGYLTANLRDKQALVVRPGKLAVLMTTPADPPFSSTERVEVKGKLSPDGTLDADVQWTVRNDTEIFLRLGFRNTSEDKWKDLVQAISYSAGYGGEVSDVHVSSPDDTSAAFQYSYHYTRKDYPDWANKRITAALPPFGLPEVGEKTEDMLKPVKLGQPGEVVLRSAVELPRGYTPQLTPPVNLKSDFAEYHSDYSFDKGVLTTERRLITKQREVPAVARPDYKSFTKTVADEWGSYTDLTSAATAVTGGGPASPKAAELLNESREAFMRRDFDGALDDLQQAVKEDPSFEEGWFMLASVEFSINRIPDGMQNIRKALALRPSNEQPYKLLASRLMGMRQANEALEIWLELAKQHPDDADVQANAGSILLDQGKDREAADHLELAVKADPGKPAVGAQLGTAYLRLKDVDKAMNAFNQSVAIKKDPVTLNNIAYDLAENGVHLPEAETWAEEAVGAKEAESASIGAEAPGRTDAACMTFLAGFWDTLGWVYFKEGKLEAAQKYLEAAWNLEPDSGVGEHLGQLYERQGKKTLAERQLALAKLLGQNEAQSAPVLRHRDGGYTVSASQLASSASIEELNPMRHFNLGKLSTKSGSAEFWLLFAPGPKLEQINFISGDERMREFGGNLQSIKFKVLFPDDHPARILRRGVMVCEGENLGCDFTLFTLDAAYNETK
jgi:tetratricopeptide (TPR) repeat protein